MRTKKLVINWIILLLLMSSVLTMSVSSENDMPPFWNNDWSYRQEIKLPISTDNPFAKFQPIDTWIDFVHPCWVENEEEHSVRVCCWTGDRWYELESQIYDLDHTDAHHIARCGLVFLVPEIADGNERYFVYYDDAKKPSANYVDYVGIEDAYYYV